MAKINNKLIYGLEDLPALLDYLIGSKDKNGKTKNFSLQSIINLINGVNGVNAIQYKFFDGTTPDVDYTTPGAMFTNNNETNVNNFTSLIFNKKTLGNYDLTVLFDFLYGLGDLFIGVNNPSDPNNFFILKVTSISNQDDYFIFNVEPYNGLYIGELSDQLIYSIYWETKEWISDIEDINTELDTKLPHGGYPGTGQDLKDAIDAISTDLDTNYYTKPEVDSKVSSVYKFKGNVANYADLPTTGRVIGDVWNALDTDINWAWTGTVWDSLGGTSDISGKEDKSNKQNSLDPDGTGIKYITVDATKAGLDLKLDKGAYPGTASDLKTDIDNIYQPDVLISSVPPTRLVNTFTYPATQYTALISKTIRTNPAQFITTIDVAATDYKRVDLIYFKSDNTIAKWVGTESLTVAPRPDVPPNSVAISFINVFGNVISDPTPITQEISIQNPFGTEQFKVTDYMRFKGATFYASEKLIEIDPLSSQIAYLSSAGNDTTAELENSKKPFLTLDKAIAAIKLKQGTGLNWRIVFLTAGTFEVNNFGTFNWWVETELAVTISFKYAQCFFANYCIFKGNNLVLQISPSVVSSTLACISNTGTTVIDWDFATLDIRGVVAGQSNLSRMIQFTSCFVKQIRIKLVTVTGTFAAGGIPIISISTPINDYDAVIFNYVTADAASSTLCLFTVGGTVLNSSITILKSNALGNWNVFNGAVPNGIKVRLGALLSSGYILVQANNVELLNGSMNSLYLTSLINLTGNASITYNTAYPTITTKFVFAGSNRNTGNFCTIKNSKISIIEGTVNQSTAQALFAVGDCAVELDNVQLNVTGTAWQPPVFQFVIKSTSSGTALLFKGDCYFDNLGGNLIIYRDGANGDDSASIDLSTVVEAKNRGTLRLGAAMSVSNRYDFEITDEKKDSIDYPNNRMSFAVRTQTKNLLVNKNLNSADSFVVENILTLTAGQYINIPSGGTTVGGNGVKVSKIVKNVAGESIFKSVAGGCGDLFLEKITIDSGVGTVFDATDVTGQHAIEFNDVNFENCSSLGTLNGFRQFTGTTIGIYSCLDGLTFEGNWSGFKLTNSNVIAFGATGTLFKKGASTVFSNRFYIDLNLQLATGSKICDFLPTNFTNNKSLQVVNCYTKVNGVIDPTTTSVTFPNILPTDPKAYFVNNIGIKNSNISPYGISAENLFTYSNDAAAAAGGIVQVGQIYIESATGYPKVRLT